ncbi:MAG: AraC family transcriptional regulator [Gemmatimonadetes bacterium]|nr:AraC family transcriptional regulator [Gemmatimonadota bacterium]NNM06185.1 AraC family transcriptional regulator [Gemmatimonadota bacterium]
MTSNEARRKEYWARINRAVDYIEDHLGEEMTLRDIASAAFFSPFHFHRIFRSLMGEPVSGFVQRIRLERAALLLRANRQTPVTRVAMDCGYGSPAAFSRAFKTAFGCTPSQWRRGPGETSKDCTAPGKEGKETDPHTLYPSEEDGINQKSRTRRESMAEEMKMDVRVEDLPEQTVAYIRHVGPYQGNSELFEGLFGRLFQWAGPRNLLRFPETQILSIYHDDPEVTDDEKLRLSVGITVSPDTQVSGEVGKMTLAEGTYAQARFELDPDGYAAAWEAVYGGWLPESGYQPDDRLAFERYLNSPKEHPEGKHIVEICVPVRPF